MGIAISIGIILLVLIVLKCIISVSLRIIGTVLLIGIAAFTIWICTEKPDLHKPFSLSTIEYLFKINKDGSMTTTKQVTQTVIKNEAK